MINKSNPSVEHNQLSKRLDTKPNNPTHQQIQLKPMNKEKLFKNFGDQCNKQPDVYSLSD